MANVIAIWLLWVLVNGQASEVDAYMTEAGCKRAREQAVEMLAHARQQPGVAERVPPGLAMSQCEAVRVPGPKEGK